MLEKEKYILHTMEFVENHDDHQQELFAWSLGARLIALTMLISLSSIHTQLLSLCGSKYGITPVEDVMNRMRKDYPSFIQRFLYFPTLLWFLGKHDDKKLLMLNRIGMLAAFIAMIGISNNQWLWSFLMFLALITLLSFDIALDLSYPWDCLLFEAGWLALFLPAPQFIYGNFLVLEKPSLLLSFLFRWLLFRVMFGFGKLKFVGHTSRDNGYIKGFLIYQPIPSIFGWLGEKLPILFHKFALMGMFFIEIIAPFLLLCFPISNTFPFRPIAAGSFIALMIGIQICGNFGHFNVLTIGLSIPFLFETTTITIGNVTETSSSLSSSSLLLPSFSLSLYDNDYRYIILYIYAICFVFPLSISMLPFNSWVSQTWIWWPALSPKAMKITLLRNYAKFIRFMAPFRICHSYGVFETRPGPTIRWVPVVIGSVNNGATWIDYEYKYAASKETSMPKFVAPHHPRLDHQLLYEGLGYDVVSCANLTHSASCRIPYRFTKTTAMERLLLRMLDPKCYPQMIRTFFKEDPFKTLCSERERETKLQLQIVLVALEPCTIKEGNITRAWDKNKKYNHSSYTPIARNLLKSDDLGKSLTKRKYWKRRFVHVHSEKVGYDDDGIVVEKPAAKKENVSVDLEYIRSKMKSWLSRSPDYFHIDSCIMRNETWLGKVLYNSYSNIVHGMDTSSDEQKADMWEDTLTMTFNKFNGRKYKKGQALSSFFNATKQIKKCLVSRRTQNGSWKKEAGEAKMNMSILSQACLNSFTHNKTPLHFEAEKEAFELIFLRLRWTLLLKFEPMWFKKIKLLRKMCPSYFELGLLMDLFLLNCTKKEDYLKVILNRNVSTSFEAIQEKCFGQQDSKDDYLYGYGTYLSNLRKYRNDENGDEAKAFRRHSSHHQGENYWQYYGLIFHAMFYKNHVITAGRKFRVSERINKTRLQNERSMTEAYVDTTGTVPGWMALAALMKDQYKSPIYDEEVLPYITQDKKDGLNWTVKWSFPARI